MTVRVLFFCITFFIFSGSLLAQTEYELKIFYRGGYESNIFRSPSTYIDRDGVFFDEDSLLQSGALNGFGWDVQIEQEYGKKHRLRIENSGWFQRYTSHNSANQSDIDIELKYDYDVNRRFDLGTEIWGSNSNRIGTNVLGEELTKNFAFREFGGRGYMESKLWRRAETKVELGWRYRNFRNEPGVESLTYTETAISTEIGQEFGSTDFLQSLELEIEYKNKPYLERTASDSSGNSNNLTYPDRHWRYITGTISYGLEIKKHWELEPFFELRHRADLFQDYFDYDQTGYGIKLGYETKRLEIDFDFSFKDRQYLVRRAPQESRPYPALNYRYYKYSLDLEYNIVKTLTLIGEFNLIQRKTNVPIETMRTRRAYDHSNFSLGIEFGVDGILKE